MVTENATRILDEGKLDARAATEQAMGEITGDVYKRQAEDSLTFSFDHNYYDLLGWTAEKFGPLYILFAACAQHLDQAQLQHPQHAAKPPPLPHPRPQSNPNPHPTTISSTQPNSQSHQNQKT